MEAQSTAAEVIKTDSSNPEIAKALEATFKKEEVKAEATTEVTDAKPETVVDEKLHSKFAALSRREKAIQQKEAEIKSHQKEIDEIKSKWQQIQEKKAKAKENPMAWLEEAELEYDQVTESILNAGKFPIDKKEQTLTKLQEEVLALKTKLEEKEKQEAYQKGNSQLQEFKTEIKTFVKSNPEEYELINAFGEEETVYNVIEQHLAAEKRLLSHKEACDLVEAFLVKQEGERAEKISKLKKLKSKLSQSEPEKTIEPERPKEKTVKTLTNQMSTEAPPVRARPKSREEELEEASKLLRFVTE